MTAPFGMDDNSVARGTELRLDTLIDGLEHSVPAHITQLTVSGVVMPVADVVKKLKESVKPWKDARAAHAVLRAVTQSRPKDEESSLGLINDVKAGLVAALGRENQALTDFGFKPQKRRRKPTAEEKLLAAAKAKLTREARHTMGSRQKAEIKATETPVLKVEFGKGSEPTQPANPNAGSSGSSTRAV